MVNNPSIGKTYYYGKSPEPFVCIKSVSGEDKQSTFANSKGVEAKFYNHDMYHKREPKFYTTAVALLPRGTYNIGVSDRHILYGDSNDSANWWRVAVPLPLPAGKWVIVHQFHTDEGISLHLADQYI